MEWVGTRSGTPNTADWGRFEWSESWPLGVTVVDAVKVLTSAAGLAQWLDEVIAFDSRRGGRIELGTATDNYRASYSLIDPPRRVVLSTERHGELAFDFDERGNEAVLRLTVTRLVRPSEDEPTVVASLQRVIDNLRGITSSGR